ADGWEELRKEFALWRADAANERSAADSSALMDAQHWEAVDEEAVLHTTGTWGHFVGDASQPLHVTVHYNGWGNYPNPEQFSSDNHLHAFFESDFVNAHVDPGSVASKLAALKDCSANGAPLDDAHVMAMMTSYLQASASTVPTLYRIDQRHGFRDATPEAVDFVDSRLAAGASELRDLIVCAWENSANLH
ncbi:MAG: S1/P1 Nuclease, partial [Candidatus Eremiobacteraeota bacterium]|nr:S1/P1 Nuclease [Candidatus Eremiobacteraeota bacterium]